jgi:hypothetical protein
MLAKQRPCLRIAASDPVTSMNPVGKIKLGTTAVEVTLLGVGGAALGGLYSDVTEDAASVLSLNYIDI